MTSTEKGFQQLENSDRTMTSTEKGFQQLENSEITDFNC